MTITLIKREGSWYLRIPYVKDIRTPYADDMPRGDVASYVQRAFPSAKILEGKQ